MALDEANPIEETVEEIKSTKFQALKVEDNAIIINIEGWRRRVYYDLSKEDLEDISINKSKYKGRMVDVEYKGDITDPFTVELLPITAKF